MLRYRLSAYFSRRRGLLALCWALMLAAVASLAVAGLNRALGSALESYVDVMLDSIVAAAVNGAVLDEFEARPGEYDALVRVKRDSADKISSVETDIPRINLLKARLAERTQQKLESHESREVSVPVGTLLGGRLLLGRGPGISIRVMTVGAANTAVSSEFIPAGINQTLHRMTLDVKVAVTVIMPGSTVLKEREKQVVLGETVIIGEVPESYTYIDDTRNDTLDKILDYKGE